MEELWKPISNYENYEVSNYGRVRNVKNGKHAFNVLGIVTNGIKSRKIPIDKVNDIKKLYSLGHTQKEISKIYEVHQSTISYLINNKTYIKNV